MNPWQSVLTTPDTTLRDAIAVLDRGGRQIAIVVDAARRIAGTVTDGDVRRALLKQLPLETPVSDVMARSPRTAPADSSKEKILHLMERHQLSQIPLVDAEGHIVGIETLHGLLHGRRKDNAVCLMAGGFGKRMRPLTDNCPKPLLQVGDKPILEIIIENFVKAGFHRFFISTHYRPEMIRERIGDGSRWDIEVEYVHEDEPLGTGGALSLLPTDAIREPMFMMNGDLLTTLDVNKLLAFHESHQAIATMCVREHEHRVPYGVIKSDGVRITSMVEKPAYRYFINAGIYVLSPEILAGLTAGRHIDMPALLEEQIKRDRAVNMFPVHEYWLDIGRMEDFQRAQYEVTELSMAEHRMRLLAIVPARGGSKRLPRKNVLALAGRPLIDWSIRAALDSRVCADVLVSTDDPEIAEVAKRCGAMVPWLRPAALSGDTAATGPVLAHALAWYEAEHGAVDAVLLLQPTSPFRSAASIRCACETYAAQTGAERRPVVSVSPTVCHPAWSFYLGEGTMTPCLGWELLGKRSQDLPPAYALNGALYVIPAIDVRQSTPIMRPGVLPCVMSDPLEGLDIDNPDDWAEAERRAPRLRS